MKKELFLSIIALVFVTLQVTAAPEPKAEVASVSQSSIIRGLVMDQNTNEVLAGAIITANGQKVYTDLDGNFRLPNSIHGKCELKISFISYQDQTLVVDANQSRTLEIKLQQR
jgi:hypothetical protein